MIRQEKIPNHWDIKKLSQVGEVITGGTPDTSVNKYWDGDIPWLRVSDIGRNLFVSDSEDTITREGLQEGSCSLLSKGSVIVATRATIGEVAIAGTKLATNQGFKSIEPNSALDNKFLAYYITSMSDYLKSLGKGTTFDEVNKTQIENLDIPVPPLDEQERIVEAVEERLERVKRLEKSVENIGRLQEEYEDSLLSYLLTGRNLSQEEISENEDWFGQIPKNWEVKKLREIGSRVSSMTEPESGIKYSLYSFDSVDDGSGYYEVDGGDIGSRKRDLNGGEVMISRLNPRINRVQKVDKKHEYPPIASSEFVAIDIEDYVSRGYLYEYLRNPILQERLTNHVTGSTGSRSRVGFDFVMESNIPIPPRSKQEEIVENIRKVDFDTLEKSYSDVSKLFDEYRNSVLSHAFRGEVA